MTHLKGPETVDRVGVRSVTRDVYRALHSDEWPGAAGIEDFGLRTTDHYGALQFAVRYHGVTVEGLDDVLGDGPAITALIRGDNPYRGVVFTTAWDKILVSIKAWAGVKGEAFPLGRLYATPSALEVVPRSEILTALRLHSAGSSGLDDDPHARAEMPDEEEILTSHRSTAGWDFCVATEADRSATMVCLEGEF